MFKKDLLLIAVGIGIGTAWFAPDIFTNTETAGLIILITMSVYFAVDYVQEKLKAIREKRESLSLTAKRVDLSGRHNKVVDIRVKRQSRAVVLPAYKIMD